MIPRRMLVAVLAAALTLTGCTSLKTIRPAGPGEPPFGRVKPGDTVVVQTRDGERTRLVVHRVEGETLTAADGRQFARSDLQILQRKAIDKWKTTELVLGVAAGAMVVFISFMASWLGENSCYACASR